VLLSYRQAKAKGVLKRREAINRKLGTDNSQYIQDESEGNEDGNSASDGDILCLPAQTNDISSSIEVL
jgi:hypothetical protein